MGDFCVFQINNAFHKCLFILSRKLTKQWYQRYKMVPTTLHWGEDRDKQLALNLQSLNKLEFLVFFLEYIREKKTYLFMLYVATKSLNKWKSFPHDEPELQNQSTLPINQILLFPTWFVCRYFSSVMQQSPSVPSSTHRTCRTVVHIVGHDCISVLSSV